jgi:hypothetical protein
MSEDNTDESVKNKVAISGDDCGNVAKYCSHFGVPSSDELNESLAQFKENPTFENQQEVKLAICKWILSCQHQSFEDNLWDAPKKAAEQVVYDLQFDKDLKEEFVEPAESEESEEG